MATEQKYWRKPLDHQPISRPRFRFHLDRERCKGCGFCVSFCPRKVLEMSEEMNTKGYHLPRVKDELACVGCGLCELICPDFAVVIEELDEAPTRVT
jgi:2-oxoglutarate ferredoxin oxidoreductase subunit delta